MKALFRITLTLVAVLFMGLSVAQTSRATKQTNKVEQVKTCQYYDSMASVKLFYRDTIGAMEQYQRSLKLDPGNSNDQKNLEKLTYYYMKAGQSFYHIDP